MSDIKEELLSVEILKSDDFGIDFKCTIRKEVVFQLFSDRYFLESLNKAIAQKIVNDLPIEYVNKVRDLISIDSVAKLATVEMAKYVSGRNN